MRGGGGGGCDSRQRQVADGADRTMGPMWYLQTPLIRRTLTRKIHIQCCSAVLLPVQPCYAVCPAVFLAVLGWSVVFCGCLRFSDIPRAARSLVFYGSSHISGHFSRLPFKTNTGDTFSRILTSSNFVA